MILINAHNLIRGGGINVATNIIESFLNEDSPVVLVVPRLPIYEELFERYERNGVSKLHKVIFIESSIFRFLLKPIINSFYLPYLVRKYKVTKVYSLGNIAFKCNAKQLVLVQNAYATLNDERVWSRMPVKQRIYLKMMQRKIIGNLKNAEVIAVQTNTIKNSLSKFITKNQQIIICPNVMRIDKFETPVVNVTDDGVFKLLFISKLYPHKNFDVLYPLAALIRQHKLPVTISLTLAENINAESELGKLLGAEFPDIFINLGEVLYKDLPLNYMQHDALFLPTLLESYSATYIEAMKFGRTILTSDMPFAREICGDAAFYFDPFNIDDIYRVILQAMTDEAQREEKRRKFSEILKRLDSNDFLKINKELYNAI